MIENARRIQLYPGERLNFRGMDDRVFPDRIERVLERFAFLPGYEARGLFFVELEKLTGADALETIIQRVCNESRSRMLKFEDRRLEDLKRQIAKGRRETAIGVR